MKKVTFEELVKVGEQDLDRIRRKYFPLIERGIITGYNIYQEMFDYSQGDLFLNYLHSDLKPEDRHFQELSGVLEAEGFLEERITVSDKLVDRKDIVEREADYITYANWEDPENMRYFTFKGDELQREKAKELGERVIGESFQYDLLLKLKDKSELRNLINLFKRYTSKNRLNKYGKRIVKMGSLVINEDAIFNAWDVPLLTFKNNANRKPRSLYDFLSVTEFIIAEKLHNSPITLRTLVGKRRKDVRGNLNKMKAMVQTEKKYVLRGFVEDYIDF